MPAENSPMISSCTVVATQAVPTPRVRRKLIAMTIYPERRGRCQPGRLSRVNHKQPACEGKRDKLKTGFVG